MSGNGKLNKFLNLFKLRGLFRSDKTGHHIWVGEFLCRDCPPWKYFCPGKFSSLHKAQGEGGRGDRTQGLVHPAGAPRFHAARGGQTRRLYAQLLSTHPSPDLLWTITSTQRLIILIKHTHDGQTNMASGLFKSRVNCVKCWWREDESFLTT